MAQYKLRLFDENEVEVVSADVVIRFNVENFPQVGQIIDDRWQVVRLIKELHDEREVWLRVTRVPRDTSSDYRSGS